ncbi:MAG: PCRF domain-containing protein [Candidatus Levybacteria bacterium]|nr:PCRF domain-containing protein [Candidatus Levybacteria bacterium]
MQDYRYVQLEEIQKKIDETELLLEDPQLCDLAKEELVGLYSQKQALEESLKQSQQNESHDDMDTRNVIVEVKGAAGGDEASIFAEELLRMYMRFAERKGFKAEFLEDNVLKISGKGVFNILKYESGVHRVQRIPKTEKKGRIHTSTVTVSVLPELKDIDLHISPDDIQFEAFRSGGHGGQNVNKVSTAVRLIHKPTGLAVTSSAERSQIQNREIAMTLLRGRLWEKEVEKQQDEYSSLKATQVGRGMRNEKIKTYNFPQDRLTDHRMGKSWGNLPVIMDGAIPDEHPTDDDVLEAVEE